MADIISAITTAFNAAIGWVGQVAGMITATTTTGEVTTLTNPLLLLMCVIPLVGLGVGLFKRLLNVN